MPKEPKIRSLHIFAISREKCRVWSWFFASRQTQKFSASWYYNFGCAQPGMPRVPKITSMQYVKENMKNEVDFLPADKHQRFLQGFFLHFRPVNEWHVIALHVCTHASTYLSLLSSHMQNSIWRVNQVCSVILLQMIHHVKLIFIPRNPLYCIIFGSKQISATDAQEHFSPADAKQRRR